jgi:hypothetical protein
MLGYPMDATTAGHYCVVRTAAGVTWAGSEEVFDATIKVSERTGVSYFIGLVDSSVSTNSTILSDTTGTTYPAGVVGFRFNPGVTGEAATWRCVMAPSVGVAAAVADAGGQYATVTTGIVHLQFRLVESTGEAHFFVGPGGGGNLSEVCMTGTSWGAKMPNNVSLSPYLGMYNISPGGVPTLSIADVGLETAAVPRVVAP